MKKSCVNALPYNTLKGQHRQDIQTMTNYFGNPSLACGHMQNQGSVKVLVPITYSLPYGSGRLQLNAFPFVDVHFVVTHEMVRTGNLKKLDIRDLLCSAPFQMKGRLKTSLPRNPLPLNLFFSHDIRRVR